MTANHDSDDGDVKGREDEYQGLAIGKFAGSTVITPQPEAEEVMVRVRPNKNAVTLELAGEFATISVELPPGPCGGLCEELHQAAMKTEPEYVEETREHREERGWGGLNEAMNERFASPPPSRDESGRSDRE